MSLNELEKLVTAKRITEQQLAKVPQIAENPSAINALIVGQDMELTQEQYEQQKQILRNNLSKIMQLNQIEEIINLGHVTPQNIYMINQMWDTFIQEVTTQFKTFNFSTFKTLFKNFVIKLIQPNDKEDIMNILEDIKNILRDRAMTERGAAPVVEHLIHTLNSEHLSLDELYHLEEELKQKKSLKEIMQNLDRMKSDPRHEHNALSQFFNDEQDRTNSQKDSVQQYYQNEEDIQHVAANATKRIMKKAVDKVQPEETSQEAADEAMNEVLKNVYASIRSPASGSSSSSSAAPSAFTIPADFKAYFPNTSTEGKITNVRGLNGAQRLYDSVKGKILMIDPAAGSISVNGLSEMYDIIEK
jgi:histone H3/H4